MKTIGWHTFRRSLASILGDRGEPVLVVKELLRHAQASTTQDIYRQASQKAKRLARQHTSELFLVTKKPDNQPSANAKRQPPPGCLFAFVGCVYNLLVPSFVPSCIDIGAHKTFV